MNNKSFEDEFLSHRYGKSGSINVSIFRFITNINNPSIKLFCFVEGCSDKSFYSGVLPAIYKLKLEQIEFIINQDSEHDSNEYLLVGKKSVLKMCAWIFSEFNDKLPSCKFIVDRDYDDLDPEKHNVSQEILSYITILPCYSFENFYFIPENLEIVFKCIFGSVRSAYLNEFSSLLSFFLSESCEYNALKRTIVKFSLHEKYWQQLSRVISLSEEIGALLVEDNGKLSLNIEPLKSIAVNTQTLFCEIGGYESKLLLFAFEQFCDEMRSNPLSVKGKLLFSILLEYLSYNCKKHYSAQDLIGFSKYLTCPGLDPTKSIC